MGKKPIVHLRVYKGRELNYTAEGKIKNENHLVKITYGTVEWKNFMDNLKPNGFVKVDVEKVLNGDTLEAEKDFSNISKEVRESFDGDQKTILTPDQKRIAELEAKLEALANGNPKSGTDDELAKARKEYMEVFGKQGHYSWSVEQIREKIEEVKK